MDSINYQAIVILAITILLVGVCAGA